MPKLLNTLLGDSHDPLLWVKLAVFLLLVVGSLVYGYRDWLNLSWRRIWAIADVCFAESIRRRVLWIIPLAVLGLIAVVQLQQTMDDQDSIRQTTKFCLFTTGLVVVTTTLILACTNLPREIENKVIFTVVTKPTTRLEIVFGKIVGFARLSATILLIMGLFSYGYLSLRAWGFERDLRAQLQSNDVLPISRPTFQHYVDAHLLNAKRLGTPVDMNIYQAAPVPGSHRRYPTPDGTILVPFKLPPDLLAVADPEGTVSHLPGMRILVRFGFDRLPPSTQPVNGRPPDNSPPSITVQLFDNNAQYAFGNEINGGKPFVLDHPNGDRPVVVDVAPNIVANLTKYPLIYVALNASAGNNRVWIDDDPQYPPVHIIIPVTTGPPIDLGPHIASGAEGTNGMVFTGREGVTGQQLKGDSTGSSQVCVYRFRNAPVSANSSGMVPLEFRVGVEKNGETNDQDVLTRGSLQIVNQKNGFTSDPVTVMPESNRTFYADVPAAAVDGGDYDVVVRCLSDNQWLNLRKPSLEVVRSEESFGLNLFKSLLILWLLSVLVTAVSVCCSTFLSWPIAVVFTLTLLLGRWTLDELGDAAASGLGRSFVADMGVSDVTIAHTMSNTVEHLNSTLKIVSAALPDIGRFAATDDIEQGISIPASTVTDGLWVLFGFGIPMTVLAYVFLRNKEVAP